MVEFSNLKLISVTENADITLKFTAGDSPLSNDVCERHNALIPETFLKVSENKPGSEPDVLDHAAFAKNFLLNSKGFSPHQLVYGNSPNIPNVTTNSLPAFAEACISKTFSDQLKKLHDARSAYLKSENSSQIRRALLSYVRKDAGAFLWGDDVFYKREENK